MDDYLIGRETLGRFIDELFQKKSLQVNSTEELNELRENKMKELDDEITAAIFGKLNDEQMSELEQLLDQNEESSDVFQSFFAKVGINPQDAILATMQNFSQNFLGGKNE